MTGPPEGGVETVKLTPLLAIPFTVTMTLPVVAAPLGTAVMMLVLLQLEIAASVPLIVTIPVALPKFVPVIVTLVPTGPDDGVTPEMLGPGGSTYTLITGKASDVLLST
jgi:hypothetical protein